MLATSPSLVLPIAAVCGVSVAALWAWGFTVDDALISVRYAHNWAHGAGWAFNPGAPASDGVTPLPWPAMLSPFARLWSGFALLAVAKLLGLLAVLASVALVGRTLGRARAPAVAGFALLLPFPLVAWAVSGMETGVATLLATFAVCAEGALLGALAAGLAATFRPELLPWALTLVLARAALAPAPLPRKLTAMALALAPWAMVAILRLVCFGRATPLAVLAKPSDLSHGAMYLAGACLACGTPLLLLGSWRKAARPVALAALVHCAVVAAVGGDWMPYARLMVPILPSLALVPRYAGWRTRVALGLATLAALGIGWRAAPAGIHVGRDRQHIAMQLAAAAPPTPAAALDVGFVAMALGSATVVDLGGLTDPEIAALPGGQTSKRVDLGMLQARGVQSLVVWGERGSRLVEQRIVQDARFATHFEGQPVGELGGRVVWLYRRRR